MRESEIKKSVVNDLKFYQISGEVVWWTRLNSGKIKTEWGAWVNLCDPGTPDFIVLTRNNIVLFLETKRTGKEKLDVNQKAFFERMAKYPFVKCFVVNEKNQVSKLIKTRREDNE